MPENELLERDEGLRWIGIVYRHRLARNAVSLLPGR